MRYGMRKALKKVLLLLIQFILFFKKLSSIPYRFSNFFSKMRFRKDRISDKWMLSLFTYDKIIWSKKLGLLHSLFFVYITGSNTPYQKNTLDSVEKKKL